MGAKTQFLDQEGTNIEKGKKKRVNAREEGVCVRAQPELVERRKIEGKSECGKEREPTIWQHVQSVHVHVQSEGIST